jgi:serine/threonine protein kinase/tetratricopeptide (TPR) repeat protein
MAPLEPIAHPGAGPVSPFDSSTILALFTAAWERGEGPVAEQYLGRLDPADSRAEVDLIYREYCLAEQAGHEPSVSQYVGRFPRHEAALVRLLQLHRECPPSLLGRWMQTTSGDDALPKVGDEIGPFFLRRELGSGGFARVFLAEQTNLENRLVVLKVSTRVSREPWLLARVRHAHIVEIVSHATVDDGAFHLICMPFWGGATLAAVLSAAGNGGRRPSSGNDLLAALDSVAAAEFPTVHTMRPAREILAGLTYNQAVAWFVARLAEALDYAASRAVAHGDVKPSNILLSADGNPLLLDFNLARDVSPTDLPHALGDLGGTVAYMAPERLHRAISDHQASYGLSALGPTEDLDVDQQARVNADSSTGPCQDEDRSGAHQADLYSLGVVMLEVLTGQPPAPLGTPYGLVSRREPGPSRSRPGRPNPANPRSARARINAAEAAGWGTVAPGLRAILTRCLDPDPAGRYLRGLELAQDLDRWRADRPLVHTREPFWSQAIPRLMRRQRRAILTATLAFFIIAVTTIVAVWSSSQTLQTLGSHKLGRMWDDPEGGILRFQLVNSPRLLQLDLSHVETAVHALREYDLLDSEAWRNRDDVRALAKVDRDDLEVWLMEQVYLYCRALEDRPHSPDDWQRALKVLHNAGGTLAVPALAALSQRLNDKLRGRKGSPVAKNSVRALSAEPVWFNEYLLGVVAESETDVPSGSPLKPSVRVVELASSPFTTDHPGGDRPRLAAEQALDHYNNFLDVRPDSFWGHYRAASIAYGLGGRIHVAEAARHLAVCLSRRPENPMLHHHRAVCLMGLDQYQEAHREVEIAIKRAPDVAEFFRTRATIRANLKQSGGLAADLWHFELLRRLLPRAFWGPAPLEEQQAEDSPAPHLLPFQETFAQGMGLIARRTELDDLEHVAKPAEGELEIRAGLAVAILEAGEVELGEAEFRKILLIEPDHIPVRMRRAMRALEVGRLDDAMVDLKAVFEHPGLLEYLRQETVLIAGLHDETRRSLIDLLHDASRMYCRQGKLDLGRAIARRAVDIAIAVDRPRGMSYYNLARNYADSARTNPDYAVSAARELYYAFVANPLYKKKYIQDQTFDAVRAKIDAELARLRDPSELYHRRLGAPAKSDAH